jgi:hypothetical protein
MVCGTFHLRPPRAARSFVHWIFVTVVLVVSLTIDASRAEAATPQNFDYGHTRFCGDIPQHYPTAVNATRNVTCVQAMRIATTVARSNRCRGLYEGSATSVCVVEKFVCRFWSPTIKDNPDSSLAVCARGNRAVLAMSS